MDNTAKSISEFLLERLKQAAALEKTADEAETPSDSSAGQFGADVRQGMDIQQKPESHLSRSAAQRAYTQITSTDSHSLGAG